MTAAFGEFVRELARPGVVMLVGALDTGKTSLATAIVAEAVDRGLRCAYVDTDVANPTVGPPVCAALRWVGSRADLADLSRADLLHFVGTTTPGQLVLQQVIATAALTDAGRREADLVVIDTTGVVSGVVGETLKYHKMELCRPDRVVALQRGGEMEPIVGMLRRFFSAEVITHPIDPDVAVISPEVRASRRIDGFRKALAEPLDKWRVRSTVFAPTLPTGLDLARLEGMLVGVQDAHGRCLGLGRLEHDDGLLRVVTNAGEGMQGLRLGSLRIDPTTFETKPVNLREVMFGL